MATTTTVVARSGRTVTSMVALGVSILGLAVSAYLTAEHFTTSLTLACPESATINCQKVTTSKWSHVVGIPVAVLGLVFFVVMVGLYLVPARRWAALPLVRVGASAVGIVSALYLVWIELFRVDAICLWCTAVHICTFVLFALALWDWMGSGAADPD